MKTFLVWTHVELAASEVIAETQAEAIRKGIEENAGLMIPGGHFGAEYAGSDGPAFIPARPATPLAEPYAIPKPKRNCRFRRIGF